jgi:hypothetical protein
MKYPRIVLLVSLIMGSFVQAAQAQQYVLSGKSHEMSWPRGGWDGKHVFPRVYCVTFPTPDKALNLVHAMFNRNSIYLTQVDYPDKLRAAIAVSTIPAGRGADEESSRLIELNRQAEQVTGHSFGISKLVTDFGPTLAMQVKDIAPGSKNGPFPLNMGAFYNPPRLPIESLSVHRIFTRGPDRIEIAVLQLAPQPASDTTESEMKSKLAAFADDLVKSLQSCTSSLHDSCGEVADG